MRFWEKLGLGAVVGLICLPLIAALAGAATVDATWRSSENGWVNFAGYGYGGPRPDGQVAYGSAFFGDNIYNTTGADQTVGGTLRAAGHTSTFRLRAENDGSVTERLRLRGPASTSRFKITYFAGTTDITNQVVAGTYRTSVLAPGGRSTVRVVIKARAASVDGSRMTLALVVRSNTSTSVTDTVKIKIRRGDCDPC